jgi:hypothetical protein
MLKCKKGNKKDQVQYFRISTLTFLKISTSSTAQPQENGGAKESFLF